MKGDAPAKHKNRFHNWKQPLNIGMILLSCFLGGRGYSWELLVGVSRPVLQILTLFQTKKMSIFNPFSDLAFKKLFHHHLD